LDSATGAAVTFAGAVSAPAATSASLRVDLASTSVVAGTNSSTCEVSTTAITASTWSAVGWQIVGNFGKLVSFRVNDKPLDRPPPNLFSTLGLLFPI